MADRKEKARMSKVTVRHDAEADAIYVRLDDGRYARTEEIDDFRNVDYDADGRAIGVEFLSVSDGVDLSDVPQADRVAEALRPLGLKVLA
jgi:uncharacterized protein YuzE